MSAITRTLSPAEISSARLELQALEEALILAGALPILDHIRLCDVRWYLRILDAKAVKL